MSSTTSPATPLTNLAVGFAMHPGVLSAPPDADLRTVAAVMAAHQVHSVMVDGAGRPRMICDLDVLAGAVSGDPEARAGASGHSVPIVTPDTPLLRAARTLVDADATHALVQGPSDALPRGIVSTFDMVAMLAGIDPRSAGLPRPRPARPSLSEHRLERVRARDVAHRGMIAVAPTTTVRELAAVLAHHRIHCVTVIGLSRSDNGEHLVWAMVSDVDVLRAVVGGRSDGSAGDITGTKPLTLDADETLDTVAARMVELGTSHAVIADADRAPMGVVSSLDVLSVLGIGV